MPQHQQQQQHRQQDSMRQASGRRVTPQLIRGQTKLESIGATLYGLSSRVVAAMTPKQSDENEHHQQQQQQQQQQQRADAEIPQLHRMLSTSAPVRHTLADIEGHLEQQQQQQQQQPATPSGLSNSDVILWASFERLELNLNNSSDNNGNNNSSSSSSSSSSSIECLLLGLKDGIQIWNVTDPNDVHELTSIRGTFGASKLINVHCIRAIPTPMNIQTKYARERPLLAVITHEAMCGATISSENELEGDLNKHTLRPALEIISLMSGESIARHLLAPYPMQSTEMVARIEVSNRALVVAMPWTNTIGVYSLNTLQLVASFDDFLWPRSLASLDNTAPKSYIALGPRLLAYPSRIAPPRALSDISTLDSTSYNVLQSTRHLKSVGNNNSSISNSSGSSGGNAGRNVASHGVSGKSNAKHNSNGSSGGINNVNKVKYVNTAAFHGKTASEVASTAAKSAAASVATVMMSAGAQIAKSAGAAVASGAKAMAERVINATDNNSYDNHSTSRSSLRSGNRSRSHGRYHLYDQSTNIGNNTGNTNNSNSSSYTENDNYCSECTFALRRSFLSSSTSILQHSSVRSSKEWEEANVAIGTVVIRDLDILLDAHLSENDNNSSNNNNNANSNTNTGTNNNSVIATHVAMAASFVTRFRAHDDALLRGGVNGSHIRTLAFGGSGQLLFTAPLHGRHCNVFYLGPCPLISTNGLSKFTDGIERPRYVDISWKLRLERGVTDAPIDELSLSADNQWASLTTSHGTSHLYLLDPSLLITNTISSKPHSIYASARIRSNISHNDDNSIVNGSTDVDDDYNSSLPDYDDNNHDNYYYYSNSNGNSNNDDDDDNDSLYNNRYDHNTNDTSPSALAHRQRSNSRQRRFSIESTRSRASSYGARASSASRYPLHHHHHPSTKKDSHIRAPITFYIRDGSGYAFDTASPDGANHDTSSNSYISAVAIRSGKSATKAAVKATSALASAAVSFAGWALGGSSSSGNEPNDVTSLNQSNVKHGERVTNSVHSVSSNTAVPPRTSADTLLPATQTAEMMSFNLVSGKLRLHHTSIVGLITAASSSSSSGSSSRIDTSATSSLNRSDAAQPAPGSVWYKRKIRAVDIAEWALSRLSNTSDVAFSTTSAFIRNVTAASLPNNKSAGSWLKHYDRQAFAIPPLNGNDVIPQQWDDRNRMELAISNSGVANTTRQKPLSADNWWHASTATSTRDLGTPSHSTHTAAQTETQSALRPLGSSPFDTHSGDKQQHHEMQKAMSDDISAALASMWLKPQSPIMQEPNDAAGSPNGHNGSVSLFQDDSNEEVDLFGRSSVHSWTEDSPEP
ncbi:hypothetical protein GQ42DRAFT_165529 [Ramicandelaber brevisporus]|nr:hypothetical protein GQ42DRAFT_165529 [Ramicandelaber brevisporus]